MPTQDWTKDGNFIILLAVAVAFAIDGFAFILIGIIQELPHIIPYGGIMLLAACIFSILCVIYYRLVLYDHSPLSVSEKEKEAGEV